MPADAFEQLIGHLCRALHQEETPYCFGGDLGVRFWGLSRPGLRLELIVSADLVRLARLLKRLADDGFIIPETTTDGWIDTTEEGPALCLTREQGGRIWEVGVRLARTPFERSALRRRRQVQVDGEQVWLIAADDLILECLRQGTQEAIREAVEVLSVTHPIDLEHLERWARDLDVEFQLSEVLTRARSFE